MYNIVISRYQRNTDWHHKFYDLSCSNLINKILIYDKNNPKNPYNIPANRGNEASVYLKYIIDHYHNLPEFIYFIQDEEYAWHHKESIVDLLSNAIKQHKCFYNVNHSEWLNETINNCRWKDDYYKWYQKYIEEFIPLNSLPKLDNTKGYMAGSQFLVNKKVILNLPKKFYENLYNWILSEPGGLRCKSGTFMEWSWHIFWEIYPNYLNLS